MIAYKELGLLDPLNQVVLAALHFHDMCGFTRQKTDLLVRLLTRGTMANHLHDDVLSSHEGQFLRKLRVNDSWIDD